jgi:hypothetical protein
MTRARTFLVIAAVVLSLAGCAAPHETATLSVGGSDFGGCLPAGDPSVGYIAVPLENTGPDPIVLSGVSINSVMGAQLVGSWILPLAEDGPASDGEAYFGPTAPADSRAWQNRESLLGATIPAGDKAMLALELTNPSESDQAAVDGATLYYTGSRGGSLLAKSGFYFGFSPIDGGCFAPK